MSWTDDRVSLLKRLWGEGHTAAEIAKELGGVTRNAVIGKAHRLKLSNRVSPIQQNRKPANKNVERKAPVERVLKSPTATTTINRTPSPRKVKEEVFVPSGDLYDLMDLQPRMCRWPSGDPKEEGFGFCGSKTISGIPYCAEHAKVAYQAATRNRILGGNKESAKNVVPQDVKKAS
ncbi:MAG: GcrA family cell cycle regulator [Alphaproteobacteria bacterium]